MDFDKEAVLDDCLISVRRTFIRSVIGTASVLGVAAGVVFGDPTLLHANSFNGILASLKSDLAQVIDRAPKLAPRIAAKLARHERRETESQNVAERTPAQAAVPLASAPKLMLAQAAPASEAMAQAIPQAAPLIEPEPAPQKTPEIETRSIVQAAPVRKPIVSASITRNEAPFVAGGGPATEPGNEPNPDGPVQLLNPPPPLPPAVAPVAISKAVEPAAPVEAAQPDEPSSLIWLRLPMPKPPLTPAQRLGLQGKERAKQEQCLARAVYFEARAELARGQMAVAQVVLNRVFSPYYPKDICSVVYQNASHHLACQFTFACDGKPDIIRERGAWARATRIARETLDAKVWLPEVAKSTHYHAAYVHPYWARSMRKMARFGLHTFYRPRNWGDGSKEPAWGAGAVKKDKS